MPSDRSWGLTLAFVLAVACATNSVNGLHMPLAGLAALLGLLAWLRPSVLHPLNKIWMKFSHALGKITNPILLGIVFLLILTPMAVVRRLWIRMAANNHPLDVDSYWVNRTEAASPSRETLRRQF